MAKLSKRSADGTSFHGVEIRTSVNQLKKLLGNPQCEDNSGYDKVNFDWTCETEDGDVFTIYDWKEYRPLGKNEMIDFHIGSHKGYVSTFAKKELQKLGL